MIKTFLKRFTGLSITGLFLMGFAQAGVPVWTIEPVAGFPPSVTVRATETATILYTLTNQSYKPHLLQMRPIQGITPSGCTTSLAYHQSCTLTLSVSGSGLAGDVMGGPVICDHGNALQCYQPSQGNGLAIHLTQQPPPVQQYTVTASVVGGNGTVSPMTVSVNSGATQIFNATPDSGYGVNQWLVDGVVAQSQGSNFTLSNITANHSVTVTFSTATLTPSLTTLALSVNCPASSPSVDCAIKNNALTGTARQITIHNFGVADATNVVVNALGTPVGTSVNTPPSCSTIPANGGTCVITVTPGEIANADGSAVPCTSGVAPAFCD